MTGSWSVQLRDGNHWIKAELSPWTGKLNVYFDNYPIGSKFALIMVGELYRFERNGHYFVINMKGFGFFGGHLALSVDGVEVYQAGMMPPPAPPPQQQHQQMWQPRPPAAQFIQEVNVVETSEVYRTEEYPFDNRFGDSPISTERQFTEESTNEFSLNVNNQIGGKLNLDAFSIIKAEIAAQVSRQVGHKIGETVTESQTLNFSVGAKSAVVYRIIWKRNIRTGEYVYLVNGSHVTIPYRMKYGLSVEVQTRQHTREA